MKYLTEIGRSDPGQLVFCALSLIIFNRIHFLEASGHEPRHQAMSTIPFLPTAPLTSFEAVEESLSILAGVSAVRKNRAKACNPSFAVE